MRRFFSLALLFCTTLSATGQEAIPYDLLITGGQVYDGTGNSWFYADVGIRDGRIAAVGRLAGQPTTRVVDAVGLAVMPGFIDLHSHGDDGAQRYRSLRHEDARLRAAPNMVMQGVTTLVVNQDGRSHWPIHEQRDLIAHLGIGPNAVLMLGHGTVRRQVMGDDVRRPATDDEVAQMRALVQQAMAEGAAGLSAGLEYNPGRWSTTDEVVALVEEIVPYGGFYIAHQRSEGADPMWFWPSQDDRGAPTLVDAVLETIEVGERTGATVVATHLKAKGAHYWGTTHTAVQLIAAARARGVSAWADHYPYNTSGTDGNTVLIPRWVFNRNGINAVDHAEALAEVLADPTLAAQVRQDVRHEIRRRGGAEQVVVFDYPDSMYVGQSLAALARLRGVDPVEMAFILQREGKADRPGGARLRGFSMSEDDVAYLASVPWMVTTSDAGIALPDGPPVHPRFYGTFPRKIYRYALTGDALTVADAVRSMTSLPAQILGFRDRGQVREGFHADLTLVDLARLRDTATPFAPHQYPEGVVHVMVGGTFVVEDGALTWALPGQVLTPTQTPTPAADD